MISFRFSESEFESGYDYDCGRDCDFDYGPDDECNRLDQDTKIDWIWVSLSILLLLLRCHRRLFRLCFLGKRRVTSETTW